MNFQTVLEQIKRPSANRELGKSPRSFRFAFRWGISVIGLAFAAGLFLPIATFAQTAEISGVITDSTEARVANANVTVLNKDTGINRATDSNGDGYFNLPVLQPGNYMITVKAVGFATQVRTNVTLDVGAHQVLNFALRVGEIAQTVQVTAAAPQVELGSSSLGAVVTANTVVELPLNGRSWSDLALLSAGVAPNTTLPALGAGLARGARGFGAEVQISGARPTQNNYLLDGVSINDYANAGPGSVLGGNLGVDAIQEFSVLTSNYSAEYGKTSGGVVNAVTRSGTNQLHGSAFEFLRNSALDARNYFDGATIPPFKRNQFGASAGGPIRKDDTFFFVAYEGVRQSLGVTSVNVVPSVAARAGQLCSDPATPGVCTPTTVTVNPDVQKFLGLYPLPNGGIKSNGDTGVDSLEMQQIATENFVTGRVDHKFSDKDNLSGTYLFDNAVFTAPDSFADALYSTQSKRQDLALEQTHIFNPTLVNSARFGFTRSFVNNSVGAEAINPLAADHSLASFPGQYASNVKVSGLTRFNGGLGGNGFQLYRWNTFQGDDDAFLTRGAHSLRFGIAVERDQLNEMPASEVNGDWSFGSLSNFLIDKPKSFLGLLPDGLTETGKRQTIFGIYVQDDWHLRPSLTFNIGLRYEIASVYTEAQGKLSNLVNLTDVTPHIGSPFVQNPTLHNFEPRVGFAWDPFRNGKTAVRGGFGIFDSLPLLYQTLGSKPPPFFLIGDASSTPVGSFPSNILSQLTTSSLSYDTTETKASRNYVMQWNLNVQREYLPSLTATIGYVGSHGVHQPFRANDANFVLPTLTFAGYLWPAPIGSGTRLNPDVGGIEYLFWGGDSFYDALQLGVVKKMSHGFQLQGSYTWSKSIDDSSGTLSGDTYNNSISGSINWINLKMGRAVSDYNVPRQLVINGTWLIPEQKSLSGLPSRIVNGWQLGVIYKVNDGVPFTPTFGTSGDPMGLESSDPEAFPDRLSGPGCATLTNPGNPNQYIKTQCFSVPMAPNMAFWQANCDHTSMIYGSPATTEPFPVCFNLRGNAGRNILQGPGLENLDFSIYKNFPIRKFSENFNAQFRAEFFNILNRTNFTPPVAPSDVFDAQGQPTGTAGLLTATSTTSRQIQFGLRFTW